MKQMKSGKIACPARIGGTGAPPEMALAPATARKTKSKRKKKKARRVNGSQVETDAGRPRRRTRSIASLPPIRALRATASSSRSSAATTRRPTRRRSSSTRTRSRTGSRRVAQPSDTVRRLLKVEEQLAELLAELARPARRRSGCGSTSRRSSATAAHVLQLPRLRRTTSGKVIGPPRAGSPAPCARSSARGAARSSYRRPC